jgi:hypothetical protein
MDKKTKERDEGLKLLPALVGQKLVKLYIVDEALQEVKGPLREDLAPDYPQFDKYIQQFEATMKACA